MTPNATYDFDWRLSGARAVAPLQVFDDGRRTWLQFAPGQALPAIFALGQEGERPIPYLRRDPYVVIEGVWPALVMRGGRLRAMARRQAGPGLDATPAGTWSAAASLATSSPTTSSPTTESPAATSLATSSPATSSLVAASPATAPLSARTGVSRAGKTGAEMPPPARPAADQGLAASPGGTVRVAASPVFRAELADGNLRRVLARWAGLAGWTFGPEHWDVDVDIPLAGTAGFGDDFKHAVRALVGATEMAGRPLQPCFYVNRVLRVVPLAQACDRAAPREATT